MKKRALDDLKLGTVQANFAIVNAENRTFFEKQGFVPTNVVPMIGAEPDEEALVGEPEIFVEVCDRYLGCKSEEIDGYSGTYGMGGAGFVGIKVVARQMEQHQWIVYCVWSAENYIELEQAGQKKSFKENEQELIGRIITDIQVTDEGIVWELADNGEISRCVFRYDRELKEAMERQYERPAPSLENLMLTIFDGTDLLV
ncbi:hypothetical protein [Listeria costaricensis]|uniref:hypothetical protein n=1 Tax=Listeria costaricensis TaxID=2026604 RepID=UPI0013C48CCA|nr:hypothetical protein [Listeria costaricensis]